MRLTHSLPQPYQYILGEDARRVYSTTRVLPYVCNTPVKSNDATRNPFRKDQPYLSALVEKGKVFSILTVDLGRSKETLTSNEIFVVCGTYSGCGSMMMTTMMMMMMMMMTDD